MRKFFLNRHLKAIGTLSLLSIFFTTIPADAFPFWNFSKKQEQKRAELNQTRSEAIQSLTLLDAYRLALKKSESVAITFEDINQARARFYRSFNYFLPTAHFVMSETFRDPVGGSSDSVSNTGRRTTPENKFTFTQPLFSGFREIAALQASGADKKQQVLAWKRAKELLFVDVMSSYYAVLEAQRNVSALAKTHRLGADRLRELNRKIKVGRLRGTDRQTWLADLRLLEAGLIEARSALAVSKNLFAFYIGQPLGARVLVDEQIPEEIFEISQVDFKARQRSDVAAYEQAYIVSEKKVIAAQADLFPTIKAEGNYYTRRVGFSSGSDWDVTVQMDVPIFELGTTMADIKSAVSTRQTSHLEWEQSRRMAELDIQNALEDLRSMRLRERALWKAREASTSNYKLVSADYRHSLVNNLDVLDALRRLQDVEVRYNDAYFLMKESYWKFKSAVGEIITLPG